MNANKRKSPPAAPFAFIRVYSRLCLLAALLVAIAGRDLMAAPGVDVTQIVRSNCNAQGCRQTRVTHPGVILGRLSDGRMVAVCSASGRTRGMALIDPGTGEKEIAGTCVAVSGQLNAAVVTFAHAGQLASVTSVSAALQQYLLKTLGQMPVPEPACQPVGKGPPPPPETPPEVEELPQPPPPPPKHPAPAPAPATVSPNSPAPVNSSALSQLKTDLISETGKLLDEHKADLLQAVQSGVAANQNGISGLPAAVENAIQAKVPGILQEGVKDLATQEGQKAARLRPRLAERSREAARLQHVARFCRRPGRPGRLGRRQHLWNRPPAPESQFKARDVAAGAAQSAEPRAPWISQLFRAATRAGSGCGAHFFDAGKRPNGARATSAPVSAARVQCRDRHAL